MTEEDELEFEREHGVPVHAGGSVIVSRWGIGLAMLFLGIFLSALLLSYYYLRLENPVWPPGGTPLPGFVAPIVSTALLLVSAVAVRVGLRRIQDGDQRGLIVALAAALATLLAGAFVQFRDIYTMGVTATEHAYGSIFLTLTGFVVAVTLGTAIMAGMVLFWGTQGHYTARRNVAVVNLARFWPGLVAIWVVAFGTLTLGPHLT